MKPETNFRKPVWECEPIDCGNAYHMVRAVPGFTHEQAVLAWLLTMDHAIKQQWRRAL